MALLQPLERPVFDRSGDARLKAVKKTLLSMYVSAFLEILAIK